MSDELRSRVTQFRPDYFALVLPEELCFDLLLMVQGCVTSRSYLSTHHS